jgi:hypothetical protein
MEPLTPAPVVLDPTIIDEYGFVREAREKLAAREKQLKEQIDRWIPPDLAAADKWAFNGEHWVIGVSAREWERTIKSLGRLYRRLGHKAFFAHCKFNLKDFDRLVPEGERPGFLVREQTGSRTLTVVKKYTSAS